MSSPVPLNPYVITADTIEEPPSQWWRCLRFLGPGFILSASIVGSGELIATTQLGARAGFVTLWVILVSCLVKVAVQVEFGKHAIYAGETTFAAFNRLPGPRWGRANWSIWAWLALMGLKFFQVGGIVGGVAIILNMIFPALSVPVLTGLVAMSVSLIVFRGFYAPIEKLSLIMIGLFTLLTLASVAMLQGTVYAVSGADLLSGLEFQLPAAAVGVAIGAFGITGVGGDEVMVYNYWLLEKGYAAKTGPREHTEAWVKRARGWIRIMYIDALLAMVAYTVVTAAFYLLGAAVLHGQGLVPEKDRIVEVLSAMYTETLGEGARQVFLIGAFVVLYSTLLSALAGWTRLFGDAFAQLSRADFTAPKTRRRLVAILSWAIPILWALLFLRFQAPGFMIMVGGIATSAILLIVLFAALHFRYRLLPAELEPCRFYDAALWVSALSIVGVCVYGVVMAVAPA